MERTIASTSYQKLIEWLIKGRISRGWSIRDLALELKTLPNTVHRIETLERRLDVNEYVAYCRALNLDPVSGLDQFYKFD